MATAADTKNVISTTLNAWSKEAYNSVVDNNQLLYFFKTFGRLGLKGKNGQKTGSIQTLGGGKQIEEIVSLVDNTNVGFVAYNETVGSDISDVIISTVYDWKYCYGNAVLYDAQIKMNSDSKYRKINLIQSVIKNAEDSMINSVAVGMFNNTTSGDEDSLDGLPTLITDDGTSTTVGGISTVTYENWKNEFVNVVTSPTYAQLTAGMRTLFRDLTRGRSMPDLIVTTPELYGIYEGGLTDLKRFTQDKMADAGFTQSLKFNGATVIFDENCPANRMYMLNTNSMAFNFHKDAMFNVGEMEKQFAQQKYSWPITAMCNFSLKNRRDQGVVVVASS